MGLSEIPLEVVYAIIEASRDDLQTLLQFSLVSKQCLEESRRYAFHRVHLGLSSTWPPTVTGPEPVPVDARPARLSLATSRIEEFYAFVTAPPNLEELHLSYVFEPKAEMHLRSQPVVVQRPLRLKTVSMVENGSPVFGELLQEDPEAFSEVVTINWNIQSQMDVDVLGRIFQLCGASLQEVKLELGVLLPWGDATNFDALELMPPIKRLCLSSHIHLPNIEGSEGEHIPFGLSYDLHLFQSLLQTQHQLDVLEVKVGLSTSNNFRMTHNLPSRILHKRKAWKAFDEYLASPLSSDLPAPIGIHVNVTWPWPEYLLSHKPWSGKEQAFREPLQREMRACLKRSLEAGRVTLKYTWYT
ncbi:hypothetical protein D9611_013176 [Ephemerocybe angulata]|uniref:Uncharacterized protein n=1 Tax=Ephemerocybe angulata TaxID=980116 RepID=A0A8H5BV95_9AGAR|nr:hypothetical protein D9611_013176 [Tulosesus angulatus]